jgi:hypothetical protein
MYIGKPAPNALDLIGQRFQRLTVTEKLPQKIYNGCVAWRCICDCGKEVVSTTGNLRSGNTKSCGCHMREQSQMNAIRTFTKHGNSKDPLYQTWVSILKRCGDPTSRDFHNYGARGIRVCDRWLMDFRAFAYDMGPRPTPMHSIDRIDNNKGYSPDNCRWATKREQSNNTRRTRWIEAFGKRQTLKQWADECGVRPSLLHQRMHRDGLTAEQAIEKSRRHG